MSSEWGKTLLWTGMHILLLLSLVTPLGFVTTHFLLIPLLVAFVVSDVRKFAIVYAAMIGLLMLVLGGAGLLLALFSLFYLVPAALMGRQYRKGASPGVAVISGILGVIGAALLALVVFYAAGFNIADGFKAYLRSDAGTLELMTQILGSEEELDLTIKLMVDMIPMMIITFAVYTTLLAHWLGRKILTRGGIEVGRLKPMKEWRLPRSLVFLYLIVLILELFVSVEPGSTLSVILINASPLLTYAFAFQAAGFLFFLADLRGWNRALPIASIVLMPVPGLAQLFAWLGVLDVSFPIRERIAEKRPQD